MLDRAYGSSLISEKRRVGFGRLPEACSPAAVQARSRRWLLLYILKFSVGMRLKDLAAARVGNGYRRLRVLPRQEGRASRTKRVYCIYMKEGLTMHRKRSRRGVGAAQRVSQPRPRRSNVSCPMDFVPDHLYSGHQARAAGDMGTRGANLPREPWINGPFITRWSLISVDLARPTDNAFIESFNGRLRGERLNENCFVPVN